jgi:hypothetical protein
MHRIKNIRITHTTLILILLSLITAGLAVTTTMLGVRVAILWRLHNNDFSTVRGYIKDAVEGLYHPAIVDPKEKRQYIYEASLTFPIPSDYQTFRYSYQPPANGMNEQIMLTTASALAASYSQLGSNPFEQVPQYRQCSKEFIVQFAAGDTGWEGFTEITSKTLADGRIAHLFKNTKCDGVYSKDVAIASYQKTLESIESY